MSTKEDIIQKLIEFGEETKLGNGKVSLAIKDLPDTTDKYGIVVNAIDNETLAINYAFSCTEYCKQYDLLSHVSILPCYKASGIVTAFSERLSVPDEYIAISYTDQVVCTKITIKKVS